MGLEGGPGALPFTTDTGDGTDGTPLSAWDQQAWHRDKIPMESGSRLAVCGLDRGFGFR